MSDLISRKALLEAIRPKLTRLYGHEIRDIEYLITNAPAVSGEAVYLVKGSYGWIIASKESYDCTDDNYKRVAYTTPQQPQEQGEAVAWRYKLKIDREWLYITKYPTGCEDSCPVIVEPLYTTPQQPQSVADALEDAAKICDDEAEGFYQRSGSLDYETNAVEFINEHAREAYDLCKELAESIRALIKRNVVKEGE